MFIIKLTFHNYAIAHSNRDTDKEIKIDGRDDNTVVLLRFSTVQPNEDTGSSLRKTGQLCSLNPVYFGFDISAICFVLFQISIIPD